MIAHRICNVGSMYGALRRQRRLRPLSHSHLLFSLQRHEGDLAQNVLNDKLIPTCTARLLQAVLSEISVRTYDQSRYSHATL
jgi:hypothetical protein